MTQNGGEDRTEAFTKGHVRSPADFPGSHGKGLCLFKYRLFRLRLPWEQHAAIIVKTNAQREVLALFVWTWSKCLPCSLWAVFRNRGDASVHARDVWPRKQYEKMEQIEEAESGELSIRHRLPNHVFYGMKHSKQNVTLKKIKGGLWPNNISMEDSNWAT